MYEWQGDLHSDNMTILHGTIRGQIQKQVPF